MENRPHSPVNWPLRVALIVAGAVVAIDMIHFGLNQVFDPFTGPIDRFLHLLLSVGRILFAPSLFVMFAALRNASFPFLQTPRVAFGASVLLLAWVLIEILFSASSTPRTGSSLYHPMTPDYLAGIVGAGLTLVCSWAIGREHGYFRILSCITAFLWVSYPICVDLMFLTEGTARGTGDLWHMPVIGLCLSSLARWALLLSLPFFFAHVMGSFMPMTLWLGLGVFAVLVILSSILDRELFRRAELVLPTISVIASAAALACYFPSWVSFITD